MQDLDLDLVVDLNTMDDSGLPWAFLDAATDRSRIVPGHHIIVGSGGVRAVATVVDIDDCCRTRLMNVYASLPVSVWGLDDGTTEGRSEVRTRSSPPTGWRVVDGWSVAGLVGGGVGRVAGPGAGVRSFRFAAVPAGRP